MPVNQLQRVVRLEGRDTREHLIQRDPERVQIGAIVARPVQPGGLFRRQIGEHATKEMCGGWSRRAAGGEDRQAEVAEPHLTRLPVPKDAAWVDVLVNDVPPL